MKTCLFKYTENFTTKKMKIFHISAQNIDCGYSLEWPPPSSSNKYPQSMFLNRNKKNNVYPCKPQFYYIKVGFEGGSKLYRHVFMMYSKISLLRQPTYMWDGLINGYKTVNSLYLKVQGTLLNTSRYPYLDISDLQNWGKNNQTTTFYKLISNLTAEVRDILKIL